MGGKIFQLGDKFSLLVWVQVSVCFHNYRDGVAQTLGNEQSGVSEFDTEGSVAVAQIVDTNIWQLGELGAAGQLLVERCARHVEHGRPGSAHRAGSSRRGTLRPASAE